jgi:transcriptional regulator with GAF, ATPase, and Fis domain
MNSGFNFNSFQFTPNYSSQKSSASKQLDEIVMVDRTNQQIVPSKGPCMFIIDNKQIKEYMKNTLGVITADEHNKLKQEFLSIMAENNQKLTNAFTITNARIDTVSSGVSQLIRVIDEITMNVNEKVRLSNQLEQRPVRLVNEVSGRGDVTNEDVFRCNERLTREVTAMSHKIIELSGELTRFAD